MRKIGIITTSHAINYGAVLQAFALRYTLIHLGADVSIINYCGDENIAGRKIYRVPENIVKVIYNMLVFIQPGYKKHRKELIGLFDDFKQKKLCINTSLLKNKDQIEKSAEYDTLICGSDQIWNLNLFDDENYFLCFAEKKPHVRCFAYSVSVTEHMTQEQEKKIFDRTRHFRGISIRENSETEWLSKVVKKQVLNTIDPVFLLTAEQWDKVLSDNCSIDKIVSNDYIFIFMISHCSDDQKIIDGLCLGKGLKRVVLNLHPLTYFTGDRIIRTVSPEQFVALIKNAKTIITDSFHATAFAIIYNKEFYNIRRSKRNSRIENLFTIFKIEDRFIDTSKHKSKFDIDYQTVNLRLTEERNYSIKYLRTIVEEDNDTEK